MMTPFSQSFDLVMNSLAWDVALPQHQSGLGNGVYCINRFFNLAGQNISMHCP